MPEALRPMNTGELLDRTFALYGRNFGLLVGINVPAPALFLILQLLQLRLIQSTARWSSPSGLMSVQLVWNMLAIMLVWFVGLSIVHPATVRAVSAVHLNREITILQSYGALKGRVARLVGIVICWACIVLLAAAASVVAILILGLAAGTVGALVGLSPRIIGYSIGFIAFFAVIVGTLAIWARYSLAIQACVVEDLQVFSSLQRSKVLAKASVGRIMVVYIVFLAISFLVAASLNYVVRHATAFMLSANFAQVLGVLGRFIAGVLTGPLATVAMSLVYYDERVRKEAFDLQLMMAALDGPTLMAASASAP